MNLQIFDLTDARRVLELTLGDYSTIRLEFQRLIRESIYSAMNGTQTHEAARTQMKQTVTDTYRKAAEQGYKDGGGKSNLFEKIVLVWLLLQLKGQLDYIDALFIRLETIDQPTSYALQEAHDRADGYAAALDYIYANSKVMGAGNMMLIFDGLDGNESCTDCQRYKGQQHPAWWWVKHDAVPPNRNFECKGYRCEHYLRTLDGRLFTI